MSTLTELQNELKAPKNQYNTFGKYKYRSCEDILEAVKPLLKKYELTLVISDIEPKLLGDVIYLGATATLKDKEQNVVAMNHAYAGIEIDKKGMDMAQTFGTSSSYARKYALNGLFLIDDTKDSDTDEHKVEKDAKATNATKPQNKPVQVKKEEPSTNTPTQQQNATTHEKTDLMSKIKALSGATIALGKYKDNPTTLGNIIKTDANYIQEYAELMKMKRECTQEEYDFITKADELNQLIKEWKGQKK